MNVSDAVAHKQETTRITEHLEHIKMLLLNEFSVKVNLIMVSRIDILSLAIKRYKVHIEQIGCTVYVECS